MKKDWRERELTMEVIVGAFIVAVFAGMAYFTIILSKEALFRSKTTMQVVFADVMGLRVGDNVVVRGMPVGKVSALSLLNANEGEGVCATLMLDTPVAMREDYVMRIATTSILGGRQLQIHEGSGESPVLDLPRYQGSDPYDLMADAAEIVNAARDQIIEGRVFEKIRHIVDQVDEVATRINNGEGLVGKLLSDDDTLYRDLQASAEALREIMGRLQNGEGTAGRLLSDDSTLFEDLEATVASARRIAGKIESGEGTFGRFLADETLYNEVEATISEIRAAVDDFRETAPVTTFSSLFFGAF